MTDTSKSLQDAHFKLAPLRTVPSNTARIGNVISTDPVGEAPRGSAVALIVSNGPSGNPTRTEPQLTPTTPTAPPTSPPQPAPQSQLVQSLSSLLPTAVQHCDGRPALYIGSDITVDTDSIECDWQDVHGQNWDLSAWQFNSSSDAQNYFIGLVHNNVPTAEACASLAVEPCVDSWSSTEHPAAPGQDLAQNVTGTVWWVLPSQHIVYSLTTTGDDTGAIAISWWEQNVAEQ